MRRPTRMSRDQLSLYRERAPQYVPPGDLGEEIVKALADLLLEALGEESDSRATDHGGGDESEDHA
jgi:hypothetical protein